MIQKINIPLNTTKEPEDYNVIYIMSNPNEAKNSELNVECQRSVTINTHFRHNITKYESKERMTKLKTCLAFTEPILSKNLSFQFGAFPNYIWIDITQEWFDVQPNLDELFKIAMDWCHRALREWENHETI